MKCRALWDCGSVLPDETVCTSTIFGFTHAAVMQTYQQHCMYYFTSYDKCLIVDFRSTDHRTRICFVVSFKSMLESAQLVIRLQFYVVTFLRATAGTAIARLSHRNSVRPSHGWIRQKRCKLGSSNLHHRLPQGL